MKLTQKNILLSFIIPMIPLSACNVTDNLIQTEVRSVNTNASLSEGEILVAPFNNQEPKNGVIQILNSSGEIIKSKVTKASAVNFQKWNINGKVRYSYIEYEPAPNTLVTPSNIPGSVIVTDENFNELKRIRLLVNNGRTNDSPNDADGHDFILIDDNHYLIMSYYIKKVNNIPSNLNPVPNTNVIAAIIQEVKDNNIVFEWDSTNYPELYSASVEGNNYSDEKAINDYAHINSMFIDITDNNLICSFRNTSQILKIDRITGNIIWRLGGKDSDFPLTSDQKFYFQHHATLVDDNKTLLLFDNGSSVERPYSRIVEFQLDEINKKVNSFKYLNAPENIFSMYMGSVQKNGNTYFIGWGSVPRITEINYKTNQITFDMNLEKNSYRAFKY